jgi:hypothetical protein
MAEIDYQNIVDAYAKAINDAEVAALLFLQGKIQFRVHNRGEKTSGELIGGYSKAWAKKRKEHPKAARQVNYVDLEFDGNLRKNTILGVTNDNGNNALGFKTELDTDKARGNEDRFGGAIFSASDDEIAGAMRSYTGVLNKQLKDALQ